MNETTTTLRSAIEAQLSDLAADAARHSHQRNYWKLHAYRDGEVRWTESINQSDDIIDREAEGFQAIPSLTCTGTGSYACNCDHCNEVYSKADEALAAEQGREYNRDCKFENQEDAIDYAVSESDLSEIEDTLRSALAEIPAGYFADEA